MKEGTCKVEVQTADKMWAGTDDTVKISMSGLVSGVTRDTGKLKLDRGGVNDHERGDLCKYVIEKIPYDLEKIESLTVYKNGIDDWALDYIKGMVSFCIENNIKNSFEPNYMAHHIKQNDTTKVTYQPPKGAEQVYMFHFRQVIKGNIPVTCLATVVK